MGSKFVRVAIMLVSAGLGFRIIVGAVAVLSGTLQAEWPGLNQDFVRVASGEMPLEILSGLFLIFWPFYLGWLEEKWRK